MKMKKMAALLLALCLTLWGTVSAIAEPDVVGDLIRYFLLGGVDVEVPSDGAGQEATDYEDDGTEDGEVYVYDEDEEEIVVEQLIEVDDYAVTDGLSEDWLNILLLGTDSRTSAQYSRTDTMIVLSISSKTNSAKLTSIMRDTWVEIPGHGGAKLNAACVYGGPDLTVRCINENFGLNIEYYALVNMECLVEIVDTLGGIRLDISSAERKAMNQLISDDANAEDDNRRFATSEVRSGSQVLLNGKQTLAYARIRKMDSDYARTERQRTVLTTIARRLQQESLLSLTGIVTKMLQYVQTNLSFDQIMTIAGVCMKLDLGSLTEFRIPADGAYESGMFGGTWCIRPDFAQNTALLYSFIYGE